MQLDEVRKVHMIGVGGIGMSALARLFLHDKKEVSGSDREPSPITCGLEALGVHFYDKQVKENITDDVDLVVYTEAMPENHEEMVAAKALGVKMVNYFEALAAVANQYYLIAVAGTHGKTTTTAMLTDILEAAEMDPTAIIGSLRSKTGSNFRAGKSKYAVVEACEYRRDFLSLTPDVLIITNIEAEHLDYYKDLADVESAFSALAGQVRENGIIVANLRDQNAKEALKDIDTEIVDYGKYVDPLLKLTQPGLHNQMNAAAANAAAATLHVDEEVAKKALEDFAGTWRRFEYKGDVGGAKVYDDYGHHPTEIRVTLQGAQEMFPDKRILLVYQPHLDSRTEKLFDDFVEVLQMADHLILTPAYAARAVGGLHDSTERLAKTIEKNKEQVEYIEDMEEIPDRVKQITTDEHIVLVMGAGNITRVSDALIA